MSKSEMMASKDFKLAYNNALFIQKKIERDFFI